MTTQRASDRTAYRFFAVTVALLVAYALLDAIAAVQLLPDATIYLLPARQISQLAAALLDLAVVGGLLGGGVYALLPTAKSARTAPRLLQFAPLIWAFLALLAGAAAVLNLLPSPLLSLVQAAVIALVIAAIFSQIAAWTPIARIWLIGMGISVICILLSLIPSITAFTRGIQVHVGETLAAVALLNWLARRYSTVSALWADLSLKTVAGLLALAGVLLSLDAGIFSPISAILVPLLYLIFAAHSYRPLANRSEANTLAPHWAALSIVLLIGVGLIGGIQSLPTVRLVTEGTWLAVLPEQSTQWAISAITLGAINQIGAELRHDHRRVTGLMPYWLLSFGWIGGDLLLAGSGLVQVYVERLVSIPVSDAETLLAPLYALRIGAALLPVCGLLIYGFLFLLRNPLREAD